MPDQRTDPDTPQDGGLLQLQPMVHVEDMAAAVSFYEGLGGRILHGSRDGDWTLITVGGGQLGLLAHPPNPDQDEGVVELNFQYEGDLAALEAQARDQGLTVAEPTTDTGFGRQLQLRTPDGLLVKVNELRPERYR
jgi:catechol 2,3-dioxygenase-like lactoylglutathione lyase family enzyme